MVTETEFGWWVMSYNEMVANTAAFIFQEVYENFCLWSSSKETISFCIHLNLLLVLSEMENVDEYLYLFRVSEVMDLSRLPLES